MNAQPPIPAARRPGTLLAVHRLAKRFPGVVALDDFSMSLDAGQVHGLVGQNGAGKSTLINILSGIYAADAGTIDIEGRSVAIRDARHARALGIATVHQELSLFPNLTVGQNLVLGREPRRAALLDLPAVHRQARGVLDRLGLEIATDAPIGTLSLAERQMVEIAKALAINPKVLILDEPTAPLSQRESAQLFTAIAQLKSQGVAILYVSHRFAEVLALCDIATVLRNGRHVITTSLVGWSESRLTDAMLGGKSERYQAGERQAGEPAITVTNLHWGDRVRSVGFTVRRGEIVGVTGLLGAGQNEIARLIGGDIVADSGVIEVAGRPFAPASPHDAVRVGICLLTEERKVEGILPNLTLRENIAVASLHHRQGPFGVVRARAEDSATTAAATEFSVVAASGEAAMRTLSGGNQQKALLARWHLADADIFVLVEPTRGVDVGARADIYRRLDALARAGKAIVIVSSDLAEVLALSHRIMVIRDGRISTETTPQEVDEERLNLLVQGVAT